MPIVRMHIKASSMTDLMPRSLAISIDKPIPSNFTVTASNLIKDTVFQLYDKWLNVNIPSGSHTVYMAINAPIDDKWEIEWTIPRVIYGSQYVYEGYDVSRVVTIPETPEPETITAPPTAPEVIAPPTAPVEVITEAPAEAPTEAPTAEELLEARAPPTTITPSPIVPNLPWYVAWLQPVLDYMGGLTESVTNFFAPIFSGISDGVSGLKDLPKNFIDGLVVNAGNVLGRMFKKGIEDNVETVRDLSKGTPEWAKELDASLKPIIEKITSGYSTAIDIKTYEHSPLTGKEAVDALEDIKNKLIITALSLFATHAAVEASSLGQFEYISQIEPMVVSKYGLDEVVRKATTLPIEKAIIIPAEQEINTRYTPEIPTYTDLINMVVKEVISIDEFKANMAKQGFNVSWSQRIWDAHFIPPNYGQILNAYFRGTINREKMESLRTLVDLDPRFKDIWDAGIEVIPDVSELTNELVKEVIPLDTYQKYLQWHGYDATWAKRIWDAHFYPPSLGDILTAWRRGIIDETKVDSLMILIDLDPRFKDIFDTRKYVDPSLSLTRFMFETGAIGVDEVPNYVHRQGYSPEHEKAITDYIVRFQERLWRRRYLVALSTATSMGMHEPNMLKKEVIEAGYTEGVADWMLKTSEVRTQISTWKVEHPKPKLRSITKLKDAYLLDKIDADKLRTELLQRGYMLDEVDLLIDLMDEEKVVATEGKRVIALSIPQLLSAYRYNQITRDTLIIKLQTRGLDLEETETLVKTKEMQWGIGGA